MTPTPDPDEMTQMSEPTEPTTTQPERINPLDLPTEDVPTAVTVRQPATTEAEPTGAEPTGAEPTGAEAEPETTEAEPEIQPLTPPDPIDPDEVAGLNLFDTPPPLPRPMLLLDGDLPPEPEPEPAPEPVDHGTCSCGGAYDADGWCTECGNPKPNPRHHFTARPSDRVAAVCDRGIRHTDNEDAMAVWVDDQDPDRVALVVCDGVTTATRSAEASLAAAEAALAVLSAGGSDAAARLVASADAATEAVAEVGREFPDSAPSCTFVAGVVEGGVATVGSVGDSRAYWLPDEGEPVRLTSDDSMAEEQVRSGVDRATAEAGPLAHTITRWIGPDAPDHTPVVVTQDVSAPGWVLLCTDGLWNYASEPTDLGAVLRGATDPGDQDPLELALALVAWANEQGGADNITVALARTGGDADTTTRQDVTHG